MDTTNAEHYREGATAWVMTAIKIAASFKPNKGIIMTDYNAPFDDIGTNLPSAPHPIMRRRILLWLSEMGVIHLSMNLAEHYVTIGLPNDFSRPASGRVCLIVVNHGKFDKLYQKYSDQSELLQAENNNLKKKREIISIDKLGNLWRESKDKYSYPMGQKSDRLKIVKFLKVGSEFKLTGDIASALNKDNLKTIRAEIQKINRNFKKYLGVKDKLIVSKRGSGYGINPGFKILLSS